MKHKRTLVQWLLFISSYAPLYIALLIQNYSAIWIETSGKVARHTQVIPVIGKVALKPASLTFFTVMLVLIAFSILFVILLVFHKPAAHSIIVSDIEPSRDTIISYIVTYILPLISLDINSAGSVGSNIFMFLLIGVLYVRLDLIYLNPILALFGYVPYFSGNRVIISNIDYQNFRSHKYRKWKGTHVSSTILLIRSKDN